MVSVDSETLFNAAAAVVSTVAVIVFVLNVELGHSPVTKVALVVAFLAGVFAVTQGAGSRQLRVLGYGVIVTSSVVLFVEVVNTFDLGDAATVVGLLLIAGALFTARSALGADDQFVSPAAARYAFVAVVLLAATVVAVDVGTGGPTYELQHEAEVTYTESPEHSVLLGSVVVANPTPLPERVRPPNYDACLAGDWSTYQLSESEDREEPRPLRAHLTVRDHYGEHVMGFATERYPVQLQTEADRVAGETFPVRQTDACPDDDGGSPYVAVYVAPDDHRYGRPV